MEEVKRFLKSLLSRKFLAAVVLTYIAFYKVNADRVITPEELRIVFTPLLAYIGIEGIADIKSR